MLKTSDEDAIRHMVEKWMAARIAGDLPTVLNLMADDALFMVPGKKPFGKAEFAKASEGMKAVKFEGRHEIQEIKIFGDWAYLRNYIDITMTPPGGAPSQRSGYTLTIVRKNGDGSWVLTRDANLMMP